MCGRYTLSRPQPGEFDVRFGGHVNVAALGRYNVAPTEAVPVVVGSPDPAQRRTISAYWGLLPPWAGSRRERLKPINARVETITHKPLFSPLIDDAAHRALVLADGWYEWMRREDPSGGGGAKVPFRHVVDGGEPIAFAGLVRPIRLRDGDAGLDPGGRPYGPATGATESDRARLLTMAIVTCPANATAARLHDRMPAVLADAEAQAAWLSPDVSAAEAVALCVPLDDDRLTIAPASPLVNDVRSADGPWLLDPEQTEPPEGADAAASPGPSRPAQTRLDLDPSSDA